MRRTLSPVLLIVLLLACALFFFGCFYRAAETRIQFSENGVITAEYSTTYRGGEVVFPKPAGTRTECCIGWRAIGEDGIIFLPVGATLSYQAGADLRFTPVYLDLTTASEAQVSFTPESGGISFATSVPRSEWTVLTELGANPTRGTLIVGKTELEAVAAELAILAYTDAPALSHNGLAASGLLTTHRDITATAWEAEDVSCTYLAEIDVPAGKRATPYIAIGYSEITYSDGSKAIIYADNRDSLPEGSLLGLAKIAYNDVSDRQLGDYQTPVEKRTGGEQIENKFSRYSLEDYTKLSIWSQMELDLTINYKNRGNKGLADSMKEAFTERTILQGDATCAAEWSIVRGLIIDIRMNGALVITPRADLYIERADISKINYNSGAAIVTVSNAVYYNGSIYIPITTFSGNY